MLNGGEILCAASRTTAALVARGFAAESGGNAAGPRTEASVIEYPDGLVDQATRLHAVVSKAELKPANVSSVTLIIGENGDTVDDLDLFAPAVLDCDAAR